MSDERSPGPTADPLPSSPGEPPSEVGVERAVRELLERIAPGAGALTVGRDRELRRELDLDSMDLLELGVALHRRFGVVVPASDHERIATVARCVALVAAQRRAG